MDGMQLAGRVAFITGGASGIGLGIARRFAAEGARLVLADIDGKRLQGLAEELGCFPAMKHEGRQMKVDGGAQNKRYPELSKYAPG